MMVSRGCHEDVFMGVSFCFQVDVLTPEIDLDNVKAYSQYMETKIEKSESQLLIS